MKADFSPELDWTAEHQRNYAAFVSRWVRENGLRHFDRGAVARLIEHGARLRESQQKLSARLIEISDLVSEASFWAEKQGHSLVDRGGRRPRHPQEGLPLQPARGARPRAHPRRHDRDRDRRRPRRPGQRHRDPRPGRLLVRPPEPRQRPCLARTRWDREHRAGDRALGPDPLEGLHDPLRLPRRDVRAGLAARRLGDADVRAVVRRDRGRLRFLDRALRAPLRALRPPAPPGHRGHRARSTSTGRCRPSAA